MNDTVYQEQLDESSIRLIRFSSNERGFAGRLKAFRLADAPPFYSASYTWGARCYSDTTIKLKNGYLPVLDSLAPFLRMVSGHEDFDDNDWWWIDSLSINLHDPTERERQVRIMANIYKRARRAVVWLGEEVEDESDCEGAVEFLKYLSDLQPRMDSEDIRVGLRSAEFEHEWAAVGNLLGRPWWTRVWTLQEFILPRELKICCGKENISRGKFKSAMYSIFLCSTGGRDIEHELVPRAVFDAAFNRRRVHQWYINPHTGGMNLIALLAYLGNHSASDSRDRIYSVLGLITTRDRRVVGVPEYTSTTQHLYAKLVRSFWNEYSSLDIICFSHIFNRYAGAQDPGSETAVPSWTPDWRAHTDFASPVPLMASQSGSTCIGNFRPLHSSKWKVAYDAPGQALRNRANVKFHENLKEMWCDGVILDTIGVLGGLEDCDPRCKSFVCDQVHPTHGILQSAEMLAPTTVLPSDLLVLLEALTRSLVLDRQDKYLRFSAPQHYVSDFLFLCHNCLDSEAQHPTIDATFSTWFRHNRALRIGSQTLESLLQAIISSTDTTLFDALPPPMLRTPSMSTYPPNTPADAESDDADTFLSRFQDTVRKKSRRLMATHEGYVGMAPCRAQLGDTVAVLFGCSIPMVLRRVGVREAWQVVGEAYIHGFMNGEVQKMLRKGRRGVHRFRLV